jgi:hypothetical protein
MPASKVRELAGAYLESHGLIGVVGQRDSHGLALIESTMTSFEVSADAARIRLLKLGILGAASASPSLFDIVPPASSSKRPLCLIGADVGHFTTSSSLRSRLIGRAIRSEVGSKRGQGQFNFFCQRDDAKPRANTR